MCFLSHGEQGVLYAKDRQFKPETLWDKFSATHCPSLAGKPKMFFIQASLLNNTLCLMHP
jgi:caspase-like apoptosis-related cysteine protease